MDTNYLIVLGILLFLKFRRESNVLYLGVALVSIYFIMNNETESFEEMDQLVRCSPSPYYDKDENQIIQFYSYSDVSEEIDKTCVPITIPHWAAECSGGSDRGLCEAGSTCDEDYKCSCPFGFLGPMCSPPPSPSPNIFYKTCPILSAHDYIPSPSPSPSPRYSNDPLVYLKQMFGIDEVLPFNHPDQCFDCEAVDINSITNINKYFVGFISIIIVFLIISLIVGKLLRKTRIADISEKKGRLGDI